MNLFQKVSIHLYRTINFRGTLMDDLLFEQILHLLAFISAVTIIIALIVAKTKKDIAKINLAKALIQQQPNVGSKELDKLGITKASKADTDLRKGVMLLTIGIVVTVLFFFSGGTGWMLGAVPITMGLVYLTYWVKSRRSNQ